MAGSHETPFKMKGSGHYGLGNSSPAKAGKTTAKQKWQALKETVSHATGGTDKGTKLGQMYASYKGRKAAKRGKKGEWYTGPKTGADVT